MTEFEKMIREMMANGAKAEDIAQVTGDTLNAIRKEKQNQKSERQKRYEKLEEEFHTSYSEGQMDMRDVAVLATLVVAPDYPEWTVENLDEFAEAVEDIVRMRAAVVGVSPMEAIPKMMSVAGDIVSSRAGGKHLAEGKKEKKTCGTCSTCAATPKSDEQKVKDFLKSLNENDGWKRIF